MLLRKRGSRRRLERVRSECGEEIGNDVTSLGDGKTVVGDDGRLRSIESLHQSLGGFSEPRRRVPCRIE